MGRTIAEKILSAHAGRDLKANEIAVCKVDFCFGQDATSNLIIDSFRKLGQEHVCDKSRFAMFLDHFSPSPSIGASTIHKMMREFALEQDVKLFDIGEGVCHQLVSERGMVTSGDVVLGADSHTCTYGALNIFAAGVGSTDLAITLASGKNWLKVPETIRIDITGVLPVGVYAKDVSLHMIKQIGAKGATYKSIEYYGKTLQGMNMDARFTIANMSVEMGAKCAIMDFDAKIAKWLKDHSARNPSPVSADPSASYVEAKSFDVSGLPPQVARPHSVDNVVPVDDIGDVPVQQGFIGTCTNGRLEDLEVAAKILKNNRINAEVKLIIAPASRGIFMECVKRGFIEIFVKAGAAVVAPGCGPCVGTHNGVPSDGENVISTSNRNFKGRMGNPNANIYLASPATVAASCIAGKIADPRYYRKNLK